MNNIFKVSEFENYQSPIEVIASRILERFDYEIENKIMTTLNGDYEIKVDAAELKKALAYDREQYRQGFQNGFFSAKKKAYWEYDEDDDDMFICSHCGGKIVRNIYPFCPWCGAYMTEEYEDDVNTLIGEGFNL